MPSYDRSPSNSKAILRLYSNGFKTKESQPDITGNILIPYDLINVLAEDPNAQVNIGDTKFLKIRIALWTADDIDQANATKEPIMTGTGSTPQNPKEGQNQPKRTAEIIQMKRKLT